MILRIIIVTSLAIVFVVPIYNILKKRTTRIKSELDEELDVDQRLAEIKQKTNNLKKDCAEEERSATKRARAARKIKNNL